MVGVGIDTDILYPAAEVRAWVDAYRAALKARYEEITSLCGHDAFLIEFDQVAAILPWVRAAQRGPRRCRCLSAPALTRATAGCK